MTTTPAAAAGAGAYATAAAFSAAPADNAVLRADDATVAAPAATSPDDVSIVDPPPPPPPQSTEAAEALVEASPSTTAGSTGAASSTGFAVVTESCDGDTSQSEGRPPLALPCEAQVNGVATADLDTAARPAPTTRRLLSRLPFGFHSRRPVPTTGEEDPEAPVPPLLFPKGRQNSSLYSQWTFSYMNPLIYLGAKRLLYPDDYLPLE
ncbi:hypothetical protein HK405_004064 [Cladochytrium tenue]|nr:hypothetical protein HK405_004064 [Cladochytrium tenue]